MDWTTPERDQLSFDDVQEHAQRRADLRLEPRSLGVRIRGLSPDDVSTITPDMIHLSACTFPSANTIHVPQFGTLQLTSWSHQQIRALTGVHLRKFCELSTEPIVQRTMQDNLKPRKNDPSYVRRLIVRRAAPGEKVEPHVDGVLAGLVGPHYRPIGDEVVFDALRSQLGPAVNDIEGYAFSHQFNSSHYMLVFHNTIRGSGAGRHRFGVRIRNSEVGSRALSLYSWLVRSVCSNGMILGDKTGALFVQRHVHVTKERLMKSLKNAGEELQKMLKLSPKIIGTLLAVKIPDDPGAYIETLLARQPKYIVEAVKKAYGLEKLWGLYGILQAIARVGVALRKDLDKRLELERLCGKLLEKYLKPLV